MIQFIWFNWRKKKLYGKKKHCFQCGLGFYFTEFEIFQDWSFLHLQGMVRRQGYFLTSLIIILSQIFEPTYSRDNVSFQCNLLESQKQVFLKLNICNLFIYWRKMAHVKLSNYLTWQSNI